MYSEHKSCLDGVSGRLLTYYGLWVRDSTFKHRFTICTGTVILLAGSDLFSQQLVNYQINKLRGISRINIYISHKVYTVYSS